MIPSIPSSLLNQDALPFLFEHKVVVLSLLWCATIALVTYLSTRPLSAQFWHAILEVEEGMFSVVASLLAKTAVEPSRITLSIVARSMFAPSPSFSSLIVHRFKLAPSLKTFNLAGMGCNVGTMSINLATKILRRQVSYALIVVTRSTSLNWYFDGNFLRDGRGELLVGDVISRYF